MNPKHLKPLRALSKMLKAISTSEDISEHATCVTKMFHAPPMVTVPLLCGMATNRKDLDWPCCNPCPALASI